MMTKCTRICWSGWRRLAATIGGDDPYARLYDRPGNGSLSVIRESVHTAFLRRGGPPPYNYSKRFKNNRYACKRESEGMTVAYGLLLTGAVIARAWALDRFVLRPMRARQGAPAGSPVRLHHAPPHRKCRLRYWGRDHG